MKKFTSACFLVVLSCVLAACGGPSHMVKKDQCPKVAEIKPAPGKSAMVISRTTSFGAAIEFETYLDQKMIGVTKGKSYFAKDDIEPGKKHIIVKAENTEAVQVDFEADKIYFLQHNVAMGIWKARVVMEAVNAARLDGGDLDGCSYYVYDTKQPGEDLTEQDFRDSIKEAQKLVVKADGKAELVQMGQ